MCCLWSSPQRLPFYLHKLMHAACFIWSILFCIDEYRGFEVKPRKIIPIEFSPELLSQLDSQVARARASLPGSATVTRSSLIRELLSSALERRAQQADFDQQEARNEQARQQRAL